MKRFVIATASALFLLAGTAAASVPFGPASASGAGSPSSAPAAVGGLVWFVRHGGFHAEREASPYRTPPSDDDDGTADAPDTRPDEPTDERTSEVPVE